MPEDASRPQRQATYLPPQALQRAASHLVSTLGLAQAARLLDVPRSGLAGVAANAPCRRGTVEVIDRRMREVPEAAALLKRELEEQAAAYFARVEQLKDAP
jgi:hypothetical protein